MLHFNDWCKAWNWRLYVAHGWFQIWTSYASGVSDLFFDQPVYHLLLVPLLVTALVVLFFKFLGYFSAQWLAILVQRSLSALWCFIPCLGSTSPFFWKTAECITSSLVAVCLLMGLPWYFFASDFLPPSLDAFVGWSLFFEWCWFSFWILYGLYCFLFYLFGMASYSHFVGVSTGPVSPRNNSSNVNWSHRYADIDIAAGNLEHQDTLGNSYHHHTHLHHNKRASSSDSNNKSSNKIANKIKRGHARVALFRAVRYCTHSVLEWFCIAENKNLAGVGNSAMMGMLQMTSLGYVGILALIWLMLASPLLAFSSAVSRTLALAISGMVVLAYGLLWARRLPGRCFRLGCTHTLLHRGLPLSMRSLQSTTSNTTTNRSQHHYHHWRK